MAFGPRTSSLIPPWMLRPGNTPVNPFLFPMGPPAPNTPIRRAPTSRGISRGASRGFNTGPAMFGPSMADIQAFQRSGQNRPPINPLVTPTTTPAPNFNFNTVPDIQLPNLNIQSDLTGIQGQGQAEYDRLMKLFTEYMNQGDVNFENVNPALTQYSRAPELSTAFSAAESLLNTGGYGEGERSALRARGVAPIRAAYAGAERNLNRQRALQGGYAPGFAAAASRMAREQSELGAEASTNVEAKLAEMIAQGKQAGLASLSNLASTESGRKLDVERGNIDSVNRAKELNATKIMEANLANQARRADALKSMTSLYGTTPAMADLFSKQVLEKGRLGLEQGNQALEQRGQNIQQNEMRQRLQQFLAQMGFNEKELGQRGGLALIDQLMRGLA